MVKTKRSLAMHLNSKTTISFNVVLGLLSGLGIGATYNLAFALLGAIGGGTVGLVRSYALIWIASLN